MFLIKEREERWYNKIKKKEGLRKKIQTESPSKQVGRNDAFKYHLSNAAFVLFLPEKQKMKRGNRNE